MAWLALGLAKAEVEGISLDSLSKDEAAGSEAAGFGILCEIYTGEKAEEGSLEPFLMNSSGHGSFSGATLASRFSLEQRAAQQ